MRFSGSPSTHGICAALWLIAACGGDATGGLATVERDSAGVTIVENGPVSSSVAYADVDPVAAIEVGQLDGPPEYQLFRVVGAHRLPDGRLVIGNAGSHELRYYGPDGRHLRSAGAEGEGPGEFTRLTRTWVRGDSIFAFDSRNRRFSVFGADGVFVRAYSVGNDMQFGLPPTCSTACPTTKRIPRSA